MEARGTVHPLPSRRKEADEPSPCFLCYFVYLIPVFRRIFITVCGKKNATGIAMANPIGHALSHADRNTGPKPTFTAAIAKDINIEKKKEVHTAAKMRNLMLKNDHSFF